MDPSLLDYVKQQRERGASEEQIRQSLETNGWHADDIKAALELNGNVAPALTTGRDLLKASLHLYGERFWTLLSLTFVPALIVIIGVVLGLLIGTISAVVSGSQTIIIALAVVVGIIILAVAVYLGLWSQLALIVVLRDRHEPFGLKEAFRRSRSMIGLLFTTGLLSGLLTFGAIALFIVPGIIVAILFTFAQYVLVVEGQGNMTALMRSRDLVIGRTWAMVGRITILALALWLASVVGQILFGIVGAIFNWPAEIGDILSALLNVVVAPVGVVYTMLLYESARSLPPVTGVRSTADAKRWIIRLAIAGYILVAVIGILILIAAKG